MKNGFTLIELLAVILILTVLIGVGFFYVNTTLTTSKETLSDFQKEKLEEIAEAYNISEGVKINAPCVNVLDLIELGYIEDTSIIDPASQKEVSGSVKINYINNKYKYTYQDRTCPICTVISGDGFSVGDEISCDTGDGAQNFYIINNDDKYIEMLSKYNLNVGNNTFSNSKIGIQNENIIGYVQGVSNTYSTTAFSLSEYWKSYTKPAYVYKSYITGGNEQNLMYPYLENYKKYLNQEGLSISEIKLLSLEQALDLGCNESKYTCKNSIYPWLYSNTYWLGTAGTSGVYNIWTDGFFANGNHSFSSANYLGVRPVLKVRTDDISVLEPPKTICKAVTNDTKTLGNIPKGNFEPGDEYICEVKEDTKYHFYILSKDNNDINLIMNSNIDKNGNPSSNDKNKITWALNSIDVSPTGAMKFLYNATKDWNTKIIDLPEFNNLYDGLKARLAYLEEVDDNCGYEPNTCKEWVTSNLIGLDMHSGYWLMDPYTDPGSGLMVSDSGFIYYAFNDSFMGVRPVIKLSKFNLK